MSVNHLFLAYMLAVGLAVGVAQVMWPQVREFRLPPYFWVLIAMAIFEGINFLRARAAGGFPAGMIGMDVRLAGFVLAIVLMVVIPLLAAQGAKP